MISILRRITHLSRKRYFFIIAPVFVILITGGVAAARFYASRPATSHDNIVTPSSHIATPLPEATLDDAHPKPAPEPTPAPTEQQPSTPAPQFETLSPQPPAPRDTTPATANLPFAIQHVNVYGVHLWCDYEADGIYLRPGTEVSFLAMGSGSVTWRIEYVHSAGTQILHTETSHIASNNSLSIFRPGGLTAAARYQGDGHLRVVTTSPNSISSPPAAVTLERDTVCAQDLL